MTDAGSVVGVVLAGGKGSRIGTDKALIDLGGQSLLGRVLARVAPQVMAVAVSANGDPRRFAGSGLPVLADTVSGQPGPLAGVLAGMAWARTLDRNTLLLSVPVDAPFLPWDLVARLASARARSGKAIACAASRGRRHPVVALWPVTLATRLEADLRAGRCKVGEWADSVGCVEVDFAGGPPDPFLNINTPADLDAARAQLS
ncbi:MAG: molybdenum cofactor guanylyltransferase MobA [Rhodospirillales bacterium]|nr:molybdenum cofactor guanylyltransferase MobA [Rhodospirillales bacterium]